MKRLISHLGAIALVESTAAPARLRDRDLGAASSRLGVARSVGAVCEREFETVVLQN